MVELTGSPGHPMKPITHGSILAVFFSATTSETIEGQRWYSDARLFCEQVAATYLGGIEHGKVKTVAGVLSAVSPSNRWERNKIDAEALVKEHSRGGDCSNIKVCSYGSNKVKAIQILDGREPLDVLSGQKVRSFYGCVLGEKDSVCVDGHAYSIWLGERVATSKTPKISEKLYSSIAADYACAAEQISTITGESWIAAQVQAVTWVAWRRMTAGIRERGDQA